MSIFQGKKRISLVLLVTLFIGFCAGVLTQRAGIPRHVKYFVLDKLAEIRSDPGSQKEWTRSALNPVLSPTEGSWDAALTGWGTVLKDEKEYKFYYSGKTNGDHQIGLSTSSDARTWEKHNANSVLRPGPPRSWDDRIVWCPMVWKEGNLYHMLYSGADSSRLKQVGYAYSNDGINWTKYKKNPVFNEPNPWAHNLTEGWGIIKVEETYYMYYSSLGPRTREIGVATSTDLVSWTSYQNTPIFATRGEWSPFGYEFSQYCPWPFKYASHYYLIVTCHNSARDTRFALYRSHNPYFLPKERQFLGFILKTHPEIPWEANGKSDTPFILADDVTMSTFPNGELWMYYAALDKDRRGHTGLMIQPISSLLNPE